MSLSLGYAPPPRLLSTLVISCLHLGYIRGNRPRRDRYEGHTESDVVYTRVHYCIHVGTLLYTHVYTFPSSIVPLR